MSIRLHTPVILSLSLAGGPALSAEASLPSAAPLAAAALLAAALAGGLWWVVSRRRRGVLPWLRNRRWASRQPLARHCTAGPPLLGGLALVAISGVSLWASLLGLHPAAGAMLAAASTVAGLLGFGVVVHGLLGLHPDVTACRLLTLPGVPGGWFKAVVRLPPVDSATRMTVSLVDGRYGEDGDTAAFRPIWSDTVSTTFAELKALPDGRRELPVRFRLPGDGVLPSSDGAGGHVAWTLEIAVETASTVVRTRFHVPVFAVEEQDAAEQADAPLPGEPAWHPADDEARPPTGVTLAPTRGRLALHLDIRRPRRATLLAGYALLLLGGAAGLFGDYLAGALVLATLAIVAGYRATAVFAERWRVNVATDGDLSVHRGPLRRRSLFVPARAITDVRLDFARGGRAAAPAASYTPTVVYEQQGRRLTLPVGPALCSIDEAEWIRRRVAASLKHLPEEENVAADYLE